MDIRNHNHKKEHENSPLTNSVQDAFLGFSFAGESMLDDEHFWNRDAIEEEAVEMDTEYGQARSKPRSESAMSLS